MAQNGKVDAGDLVTCWKDVVKEMMALQTYFLRKEHISRPAYLIMHYLFMHGPQQLTTLSEIIEVSKPTITSLIDNLESMNLVQRVHNDMDRRSYSLHLTSEGEKKLSKLSSIYDGIFMEFINESTEEDLVSFKKSLNILLKLMKSMALRITED
ncbi:MAG: MarR family transcriptional regulator [Candidatus Thermoplasmatota archaeon]|jgi:DNA-binding MarR family transcriptional regulator|nr:MarR family transcriptional regulator [Candidatus Thermoplasmatota archaeon]